MALFFRLLFLALLIGASVVEGAQAQDDRPEPPAEPPSGDEVLQGPGESGDRQGSEQPGDQEQGAAAEQPPEETTASVGPAVEPQGNAPPGDDIIYDPELEGVPPVSTSGQQPSAAAGQEDSTGIVRAVLRSRIGTDVQWEDPREEVWEATQMALLEATVRRSENLRFMVGLRARHQFSAMKQDTSDAQAERMELDVTPTAGYADATLADGLHLRLGYQIVRMGRFDVFSASNFLNGLDVRNGPATLPEAAEFAQPALRLDWDAQQWLSLKAIYLPFFQPHLIEFSDSDYALMPVDQETMDALVSSIVGRSGDDPRSDYVRELMRKYLPRSARSRSADSGFSVFAPDPDLRDPQGALRVTAHGAAGEAALTVGTALERFPAMAMTDEAYQTLLDMIRFGRDGTGSVDLPDLEVGDPLAMQVFYDRFYVFSLDGALDVGPVQLGAETAYLKDRTVYAAREDAWPTPEYTDILHLGLRAEYVGGMDWVATLEGFFDYSLYLPFRGDEEWMFMEQNRFLRGVAGHVAWSPSDWGWTFEVAGAVLTGPSYLVAPRIETRLVAELYAEVGAFFVGGPSSPEFGGWNMTLGGLYDSVDQVFVGLRWLP